MEEIEIFLFANQPDPPPKIFPVNLREYLITCSECNEIPLFYGLQEFMELFRENFILPNFSILEISMKAEGKITTSSLLVVSQRFLQEIKTGNFFEAQHLLEHGSWKQPWYLMNFDPGPHRSVN